MTQASEPLKVDSNELLLIANRIDGHASEFGLGCKSASSRAGSVGLGSGGAAAALPQMLESWYIEGLRFAEQFDGHAQRHREAAPQYSHVDDAAADDVDVASAGF